MTAWTDAIDAQLDALDAQATAETAQRATLVAQLAFAAGQLATQIEQAIVFNDQIAAQRVLWRAVLVEARALGYLPDPRSKFFNEDLGGFLQ